MVNKSVPEESHVFQAFESNCYVCGTDILSFNNKERHQFDVEAMPRYIYVDGVLKPGVVAILSNPVQLCGS
jgi:hypothetical protein